MEHKNYLVKIELIEDLLGTVPKDKEVYATYIATKAPAPANGEEETATVQEVEERGWTGFHHDDEGPFLYDYVVKGFLSESASAMKTWGQLKQLKDKFKRYVFVFPRRVRLPKIADTPLERPLRAMTALGPRVTVVRSDVVKAGAVLEFNVRVLDASGITENCLKEVLEYGELLGLGQWRTGSWGRFKVKELTEV
jgi:hypothetical protein